MAAQKSKGPLSLNSNLGPVITFAQPRQKKPYIHVAMPFDKTGWPAIEKASKICSREKRHRMYHVIGEKCPCDCIPLVIHEEGYGEVRILGDDIVFLNDDKQIFSIQELLKRIGKLEAEVEELKK